MNERLKDYLDKKFYSYNDLKIVKELKEELFNDMTEKLNDLKKEGYDDETAYKMTVDSLGDIAEILESINVKAKELQQRTGMDFSKSDLRVSDFKNVSLRKSKFHYTDLVYSDFSNSDLSESSFKACDLRKSNFNSANLTDCSFAACDMGGSDFHYTDFTRAKISKSSFKNTDFKENIFLETDFGQSDLSGVCFDDQKFNGVSFDNCGLNRTSFRNAVLINVSFRTDVKKADFTRASMDKITYAILKGYKADLSSVNIIE